MNCREEKIKNAKEAQEAKRMRKFMVDNDYVEVGPGKWKSLGCILDENSKRRTRT